MADCFTDEPVVTGPTPIRLGVIGNRADATQEKIVEDVMTPLLEQLGRPPERILLPSEGTSSIFLGDWAEQLRIPTQVYEADWRRHQRRALVYRDARIQEEATHFLIFLNKRSVTNEKIAMRLARKGHPVLTVTYADWSLEYLTLEEAPTSTQASSQQKSPHQTASPCLLKEPDRTRGTGKGQGSRQLQQPKGLGSQQTLREAWAT